MIKANENKNFLNAEGLQMKHTSHPCLHQIPLPEGTAFDWYLTPNMFMPLVLYLPTLSKSYWHPDMKGYEFRCYIFPHSFLYSIFLLNSFSLGKPCFKFSFFSCFLTFSWSPILVWQTKDRLDSEGANLKSFTSSFPWLVPSEDSCSVHSSFSSSLLLVFLQSRDLWWIVPI